MRVTIVRTIGLVLAAVAFAGWLTVSSFGPLGRLPFYGLLILQSVSIWLSTYRFKSAADIAMVGICIVALPLLALRLRGISW